MRSVAPNSARLAAYTTLVHARKDCRACAALVNPSACDGGVYDSEQIGPWSLWQGNLNAEIVIVGQDWGDTRYFLTNRGREAGRNPTNETLVKLLGSIDVDVAPPNSEEDRRSRCFFTNAVLCLKQHGGLQGKAEPEWFMNCGRRFLRPTIDLIAPKAVVSLGEQAYRGIMASYGMPRMAFRIAVERPEGLLLTGTIRHFPMYHCGRRILNKLRPMEQQLKDWARVRSALRP
jgi:uracil-DNA glycosylase